MSGWEGEYTSLEICAGAGGQAVGLHNAGFRHRALIEVDPHAVQTLRHNTRKQGWEGCEVLDWDLTDFDMDALKQVVPPGSLSLLAGGVPCPPFSLAGKQLGEDDERDLFPVMLEMVSELRPRAVMIENVRGLLEPFHKFASYRDRIRARLEEMDYRILGWEVLEARDYGVPQLRPRAILVAMHADEAAHFQPSRGRAVPVKVAEALDASMRARYAASERPDAMDYYRRWKKKAEERGTVAPTLVGGSKKHGGADLGPTRAKRAWAELGVDGHGVADDLGKTKDEDRDLFGERGPKLTVAQAAIIQGFPEDWEFIGRKTAAYRQVGNAFPSPVAEAVGKSILDALKAADADAALPECQPPGLIEQTGPLQLTLTG
ncbi:DNA (cytosine-5-)-methyltransferase [Nocardiopsis tropica]|uniref:Cytosine-specific methyltransferase n=1 Tax=Nocardiopsis tropica TaxID=109330 RepID=A0ABU7KQX9_9ACTN|nr:DNA (cytosine-5-)-methyltransferase [Nocardiopsis umidischolae]MEE2051502.1 DNA (cytosine-5-)-methyltransferase [Nocardiopsis umidischolae]